MKLTKEQLKEIIKEELEAALIEEERTGLLQIGRDLPEHHLGPVLVFKFKGENKAIEVFSKKVGLSEKHVGGLAAKEGSTLGEVDPRLPAYFAKRFQAPYNDPARLAGLRISLMSSYNAEPATARLR